MNQLLILLPLLAFTVTHLKAAGLEDLSYDTTDGEVTITDCRTTATGELVIPATIEGNPVISIGDRAFYQCRNLTAVTIPDSVTNIGILAFSNCISLTSFTIPDGVSILENGTFSGCTNLTSVTVPDSVISIGTDTFHTR